MRLQFITVLNSCGSNLLAYSAHVVTIFHCTRLLCKNYQMENIKPKRLKILVPKIFYLYRLGKPWSQISHAWGLLSTPHPGWLCHMHADTPSLILSSVALIYFQIINWAIGTRNIYIFTFLSDLLQFVNMLVRIFRSENSETFRRTFFSANWSGLDVSCICFRIEFLRSSNIFL